MTIEKSGLSVAKGVPFDKLDRYWAFAEGQGATVHDHTPNADHGSITGGTWTTGDFSQALDCDGSATEIDVGGVPAYDGGPFTIVIWATHDTPNDGDEDQLLSLRNNNYLSIRGNGSGTLYFSMRDTANNQWIHATSGAVAAGMPTMWVCRSDGSTMELLMARADGTRLTVEDSETVPTTGAANDSDSVAYRRVVADRHFDGQLEGVMSFGTDLSDEMLWRLLHWRSRHAVGPYLPIAGGTLQGAVDLNGTIVTNPQTTGSSTDPRADTTADDYLKVEKNGTVYYLPLYS